MSKPVSSQPWDFGRFCKLSTATQKDSLLQMLEGNDERDGLLQSITENDEFVNAASESNGAMFFVDVCETTEIDLDQNESSVRARFDFSASAYEEQSDFGDTLNVRGTAVFVVNSNGETSVEELCAEAVYPGDEEHDVDVDLDDFEDEGDEDSV